MIQTLFTIEPQAHTLEQKFRSELAGRDAQIADLTVELTSLRDSLECRAPNADCVGNCETVREIEIRVAEHFDRRKNIIVPNVSWGLFSYELDMVVLYPTGWASEIEIKISKSDLLADKKKSHQHKNRFIRYLWFAIPEKISDCVEHIPERAGIIVIPTKGSITIVREPQENPNAQKFSDAMRLTLARLGAIRVWNLKRQILEVERRNKKP